MIEDPRSPVKIRRPPKSKAGTWDFILRLNSDPPITTGIGETRVTVFPSASGCKLQWSLWYVLQISSETDRKSGGGGGGGGGVHRYPLYTSLVPGPACETTNPIPRPERRKRKVPGFHCLCMRLIMLIMHNQNTYS